MTLYDKIKEMNIEDMASAIAKIASNCYDCGGCHVGDGGCLTCIEVQLKRGSMTNFEAIKSMDKDQIVKYFTPDICDRFIYPHHTCRRDEKKYRGIGICHKCVSDWLDKEVGNND